MTNTFGLEGVEHGKNNLFFLKQLSHAREIRQHIVECFERAAYPTASDEERKRLLTFVIVGGGPISVEFAGELHDFVQRDLTTWYPDLAKFINVTLIEATDHLLGHFDPRLVAYVERLLSKRKFDVRKGMQVTNVEDGAVTLSDGSQVPCGMVVWSTGIAPTRFTRSLIDAGLFASDRGRLCMDEQLRLLDKDNQVVEDIFGLGDCAVTQERPLPTLGQIARQQAMYLAARFGDGTAGTDKQVPFGYSPLLQMSGVGWNDAVIDTTVSSRGKNAPVFAGLLGKLVWSTVYWYVFAFAKRLSSFRGTQVSITNKILIPMHWFKSFFFGRDISKF
eukprot:scaffold75_cov217-Pinguiococcus_pyrenoidosus.AAC.3